jgi:hypothetical protein
VILLTKTGAKLPVSPPASAPARSISPIFVSIIISFLNLRFLLWVERVSGHI